MSRSYSESQMGDLWQDGVLRYILQEASTLRRFFASDEPIKKMHIDPDIHLTADADAKCLPVSNKLDDLKAILQKGDGLLVSYPDGKRILIKQRFAGTASIYTTPEERKFSVGQHFDIWIFNREQFIEHKTRALSGQHAHGSLGGSNIFIDYIPSAPGRLFFMIPNSEFQPTRKRYNTAVGVIPGNQWDTSIGTEIINKDRLVDRAVKKYAKAIQKRLQDIVPAFKKKIDEYIDSESLTDKELIQFVTDYRKFLAWSRDAAQMVDYDDFSKQASDYLKNLIDSLSPEEWKKRYDVDARDDDLVFVSYHGLDRFLRDFIVWWMKQVTSNYFGDKLAEISTEMF